MKLQVAPKLLAGRVLPLYKNVLMYADLSSMCYVLTIPLFCQKVAKHLISTKTVGSCCERCAKPLEHITLCKCNNENHLIAFLRGTEPYHIMNAKKLLGNVLH